MLPYSHESLVNLAASVPDQWKAIFASLGDIVLHGTQEDLDMVQLWLADYVDFIVSRPRASAPAPPQEEEP